ncbi:GntR family transcriptional regulator [Asaia sp. BMEF1]|uniref:GntR family transcriptional regulator n=1 Tax=Asaia sp. BMEF1 TaxID=3155932 RepID=UPI003F6747F5
MTMDADGFSIDRLSTTPYYLQLSNHIEAMIEAGKLLPGNRLPSESDFCTRYELSRATVRQSLQTLETRGVVQRISGRGAFVSTREAPQGWMIQGEKGFLETALGHGRRDVTTSVTDAQTRVLPDYVCKALGLDEGSEGFGLSRLRALGGMKALYSVNYSPPLLTPVLEAGAAVLEGRASLTALLAEEGYSLQGAHRSIVAVAATKDIASRLDIRTGAPILRVRSVSWRRDGLRYDFYEAWVRSDLIPLEVDVSVV